MNVLRSYDCYLTFGEITDDQRSQIAKVFSARPFEFDLFEHGLEFEYAGRDASGVVVETFRELAAILQDAEGGTEVRD